MQHVDVVVNDFANKRQIRIATVYEHGGELVVKDAAAEHEHYLQGVVAEINKGTPPAERLDAMVHGISGDYMFVTAPHTGSCPFGRKNVAKMRRSSTRQ